MKITNTSFKNINLDFDPKIDSQEDLEKLVLKFFKENQDFFGEKKINIEIKFLYQRKDMDEICGCETPEWHVGFTKGNQISIFSPLVFEKVSNHPQSDFSYTLTHEIAHVFINELLHFHYPKWLNEGIAGYIAEQYKIRPVGKIDKFSDLHDKENWNKFYNFSQAFSFTKYLIDKFGKNKILDFLKNVKINIGSVNSYYEFVKFFDEFLKADFDQEVSIWQKS